MKRAFDLFTSVVAVVLLLPFFLIFSVVIALESRGGVIYKQVRVGQGGRDFHLLKFRTMRVGSDQAGLLTVGARDHRITRFGFFLRKYKLDELPQLFNIIKNDMSIVGPRPEVRKYVDLYTPEQRRVLTAKPGLTDFASLKYINENALLAQSTNPEQTYIQTIMPEKLALNLQYIEQQSFWVDLKIIGRTIWRLSPLSSNKGKG